jgi:hypothetical protein
MRGNVFEITQQLDGIDYGEHVILIYPNLDSLRESILSIAEMLLKITN